MFSLFIRRDGLIEPPSLGKVDHHCHILPGIDDGPSTVDGSMKMARLLYAMGVRTIVATPHVISDIYPNTTAGIRGAVDALQKILSLTLPGLQLVPGAEYYCEPAFLDAVGRDEILCFGDEKYVLFESPVERAPDMMRDLVFAIASEGFTPLLAHAERYHFLQDNFATVETLHRMGVAFQVNHPSFLLPRTSRRGELARLLYKKGMVSVLGSDMHRATQPAPVRDEGRFLSQWFG